MYIATRGYVPIRNCLTCTLFDMLSNGIYACHTFCFRCLVEVVNFVLQFQVHVHVHEHVGVHFI